MLEVASASTADQDTGPKRLDYESLGISEYWRFDETGDNHRTKLAGDRLAGGRYEPIDIEELADGVLRGYSAALNLHLRWEQGGTAATARRLSNRLKREERAAKTAGGEPPLHVRLSMMGCVLTA